MATSLPSSDFPKHMGGEGRGRHLVSSPKLEIKVAVEPVRIQQSGRAATFKNGPNSSLLFVAPQQSALNRSPTRLPDEAVRPAPGSGAPAPDSLPSNLP